MDLVTIDPVTFQPRDLIQNFSSLTWTERYTEYGDFTLTTGEIEKTLNALPLNSMVGLLDSKEVMIVEDYKVTKNKGAESQLEITGKSAETLLSRRASVFSLVGKKYLKQDFNNYKPENLIAKLCNNLRGNSFVNGVDRSLPFVTKVAPTNFAAIPYYTLPFGNLYDPIKDIADVYSLGLKAYRTTSNTLTLEVYQGTDRSINSNHSNPIIFSSLLGDFEEEEYYSSLKDYANFVSMHSTRYGSARYLSRFSGYELFEKAIDGSSIKMPEDEESEPEVPTMPNSFEYEGMDALYQLQLDLYNAQLAVIALLEYKQERKRRQYEQEVSQKTRDLEFSKLTKKTFFSGKIASTKTNDLGVKYNLGDIVTLQSDFGFTTNMRITEYIRSENMEGETYYPGLSNIKPPPVEG